jgi:hypothetical protein
MLFYYNFAIIVGGALSLWRFASQISPVPQGKCTKPAFRKEWRALPYAHQKQFIYAIKVPTFAHFLSS